MRLSCCLVALGGGRTVNPNLGRKSVTFALHNFHNCHRRQLPRICVIVRTILGGEEGRGGVEEKRKEMGAARYTN